MREPIPQNALDRDHIEDKCDLCKWAIHNKKEVLLPSSVPITNYFPVDDDDEATA